MYGSVWSRDNATTLAVAGSPVHTCWAPAGINNGPLASFQAVQGSPHKLQYTAANQADFHVIYMINYSDSTCGGTVGFRVSKNGLIGTDVGAVPLDGTYSQTTNDSNNVCAAQGQQHVTLVQNDILEVDCTDESGYQPVLTMSSFSLCVRSL